MAEILNGKVVSDYVKTQVKLKTDELKTKGIEPCLAVIIVEGDPASRVYVNNKKRACEVCGIKSLEYALPGDVSEEELLTLIDKLNNDSSVHGILCQLPVPKHIDEKKVIDAISPLKDVDGFSAENVGKIWLGDYEFSPCTPMGVIEILDYYNIPVEGRNCVVVGRSNIVGKPMAALLLERNATVTVCHSRTKDLSFFTKNADIIVAAVGRPNFITADMVSEGAVVIDVGINRLESGKLCGDVDFDAVSEKAGYITPVPGGCGPMTIAVLMKNTLAAAMK